MRLTGEARAALYSCVSKAEILCDRTLLVGDRSIDSINFTQWHPDLCVGLTFALRADDDIIQTYRADARYYLTDLQGMLAARLG